MKKTPPLSEKKNFRPEPEQYTELLDTRIQIRPDFRDKLIEQLKGTFGKYYDYHRRDIAANEVDYLNVEDPDVFSPIVHGNLNIRENRKCGEISLLGLLMID